MKSFKCDCQQTIFLKHRWKLARQ